MFLFDSDDFDRQMNMEKMVWGRLRRLSLTSVRTAKHRIFLIDSVCFDCLPFFLQQHCRATFFKLKQVKTTSPIRACETTLHKADLPDKRMGCQAGLEDQNMHRHGVTINIYESLQQAS